MKDMIWKRWVWNWIFRSPLHVVIFIFAPTSTRDNSLLRHAAKNQNNQIKNKLDDAVCEMSQNIDYIKNYES